MNSKVQPIKAFLYDLTKNIETFSKVPLLVALLNAAEVQAP